MLIKALYNTKVKIISEAEIVASRVTHSLTYSLSVTDEQVGQ